MLDDKLSSLNTKLGITFVSRKMVRVENRFARVHDVFRDSDS